MSLCYKLYCLPDIPPSSKLIHFIWQWSHIFDDDHREKWFKRLPSSSLFCCFVSGLHFTCLLFNLPCILALIPVITCALKSLVSCSHMQTTWLTDVTKKKCLSRQRKDRHNMFRATSENCHSCSTILELWVSIWWGWLISHICHQILNYTIKLSADSSQPQSTHNWHFCAMTTVLAGDEWKIFERGA